MNINALILLIAILLSSIFAFFKPLKISGATDKNKDIPVFEIRNFILYELDRQKLVDVSNGESAIRYKNRYVLNNFVFTDNSQENLVNLSANIGIYKNDTILLKKNVLYTKSDGLEFKSQKVFYNRKKGYIKSDVPFVATLNNDIIVGDKLYYDIKKEKLKAKNVKAKFQLKQQDNL